MPNTESFVTSRLTGDKRFPNIYHSNAWQFLIIYLKNHQTVLFWMQTFFWLVIQACFHCTFGMGSSYSKLMPNNWHNLDFLLIKNHSMSWAKSLCRQLLFVWIIIYDLGQNHPCSEQVKINCEAFFRIPPQNENHIYRFIPLPMNN